MKKGKNGDGSILFCRKEDKKELFSVKNRTVLFFPLLVRIFRDRSGL
jgi:hypothetical protein